MEDALELESYLPLSFKNPNEQAYVRFLWDIFETNYKHGKFQFAYLAYHMLTMIFVYFNIWKIRRAWPADFQKSLIGFDQDTERKLAETNSPFAFAVVNERAVLRFLKLVNCDNSIIGRCVKLIKQRNEVAHANGNIFFDELGVMDRQLVEVLRIVDQVHIRSRSAIDEIYWRFLSESGSLEDREHEDIDDQIQEVLIRENYMSRKDIEICMDSDVRALDGENGASEIRAMHERLRLRYLD